jgi:hypothetical protein
MHSFLNQRLHKHTIIHRWSSPSVPSLDLSFLYFQENVSIKQLWYINGSHYSKTPLEACLLQDAKRAELTPVFVAQVRKLHCHLQVASVRMHWGQVCWIAVIGT